MRSISLLLLSTLFALQLRPAAARAEPPTQPLSLGDALRLAASRSPELEAVDENVRQFAAARAESNPVLNSAPRLSLVAGMRDTGSRQAAELGLGFSQAFSLSSVAEHRGALGDAGAELALSRLAARRLEVLAEAARSWVRLKSAEEQLLIERQREERERGLLAAVSARRSVGALTAGDEQLARAHAERAASRTQQAEIELQMSQHELSLVLGLAEGRQARTRGPMPSFDALDVRASQTPDVHPLVASAQAGARYIEAQADLQQAQGEPQMSVGAQILREGSGDWVALGSLSLPWPLINTNSYQAAQQRAPALGLRKKARHMQERSLLRTRFFAQRVAQLRRVEEQITQVELKATRAALEVVAEQYEAGKIPAMTLLVASSALTEVQQQLQQVRLARRLSQIELAFESNELSRWKESIR